MNHTKSVELSKRFNELFPGGHSNFGKGFRSGNTKIFANKASGSHVWDVDGNEYISYGGGLGPLILGRCNREYTDALEDYLENQGTVYGSNILFGEDDVELAELICKYVPCADAVKFCCSGTEAVQLAIRVGRAYTGKNLILRFDNMYHGWVDNVVNQVAQAWDKDRKEPPYPEREIDPERGMCSEGCSPLARDESLIIPYNNFEALETVFERYHDEIAIAILEPMFSDNMCIHPVEGYLERLQELCKQYNVVLCFDEIVNGFRTALGGAQEYLGITPDLCTLGKGIAGGLPFSAIAGKKEIMDIFRQKFVLGGGTFNGYGLGIRAALTAIKIYTRNDGEVIKFTHKQKEKLIDGFEAIANKLGVDLLLPDSPNMFYTVFGAKGGRQIITSEEQLTGADFEYMSTFRHELREEGVLTSPVCKWFLSSAHTDEDIEKTLEAFEKAVIRTEKIYGRM